MKIQSVAEATAELDVNYCWTLYHFIKSGKIKSEPIGISEKELNNFAKRKNIRIIYELRKR